MDDLIESVHAFFLHPRRLSRTCGVLISCLSFLVFLGLVSRLATAGHAALLTIGRRPAADVTLEQLVPGLPTWFIPEALAGYGLVLFLMALAFWGLAVGRQIDRWHEHL